VLTAKIERDAKSIATLEEKNADLENKRTTEAEEAKEAKEKLNKKGESLFGVTGGAFLVLISLFLFCAVQQSKTQEDTISDLRLQISAQTDKLLGVRKPKITPVTRNEITLSFLLLTAGGLAVNREAANYQGLERGDPSEEGA